MIGQIAALNQKEITLDELHKHVAVDNNELLSLLPDIALPTSNTQPLDIAIVGISGIFPDAHNIEEYWRNIVLGKIVSQRFPIVAGIKIYIMIQTLLIQIKWYQNGADLFHR